MKIESKLITVTALLLSGCVATDVGNPDDGEFAATVDFVGYEANGGANAEPMPTGLTLASGVEIDRVVVGFDRFKLRDAEDCEGDSEIDVERYVVSELLEGSDYPELPRIVRDVRQFCRFELEVKKVSALDQPDGAPDEIVDRAVWIEGRLPDGTPFTIETREDDKLRLEPTRGEFFELPDGESRLFLAFDLNTWFDGLSFDDVGEEEEDEPVEDGVLRIDAGVDEDWTKQFRENLVNSARLFRDLDDDGQLDAEEEAESLAVGTSAR
jgi:hypothetical protein